MTNNQKPIGLLSRGSEALGEKQAIELLNELEAQPAATRSWPKSRILRESTIQSSLRPRVLKMIIDLCIGQNRPELEPSLRAFLDLMEPQNEIDRYEKMYAAVLVKSNHFRQAFETNQLIDFVAAVVLRDFYKCLVLTQQEPDPQVQQLMKSSLESVAIYSIEAINKGIRPFGRPQAIADVEALLETI